ncbi:hypothetical protein Plhal304r1_c038g0113611 [Plasmopara halstedii]
MFSVALSNKNSTFSLIISSDHATTYVNYYKILTLEHYQRLPECCLWSTGDRRHETVETMVGLAPIFDNRSIAWALLCHYRLKCFKAGFNNRTISILVVHTAYRVGKARSHFVDFLWYTQNWTLGRLSSLSLRFRQRRVTADRQYHGPIRRLERRLCHFTLYHARHT